jgi:uncharacterized protein YigE (DUF2233 family)
MADMAKPRAALSASFAYLLPLLSVVAFASQAQQTLKISPTLAVTDWGTWNILRKGVEFRKITMERSESGTLELKLLRFDSGLIVPRVLFADQFHLKGASAKTFAEKSGAIAAINANYFDEKGRPLAYLKTTEKEVNPTVSKHALYTGIFGVREFVPFVAHRDNFRASQASEALQSGPLLLHKGALEILNGPARYARRSVIGLDKDGRILIGATDAVLGGLSFPELQELFTSSNRRLDATDLLNLDGGGSAQLYVKAGKFEEWLSGTSEVPVAIGFFAKPN